MLGTLLRRSHFAAGWRLLVAVVVVVLIQPAPPLVTTGPPQEVRTVRPMLGVHTRLTDEVEPWKIKRTLELVREMGASWIVEFFPWAYYHAADGSFAWAHPDLVIDHASAQGLTIIARLGLTPQWARPEGTPLTYLDDSAYDDFAAYAAAFAARYRGRVGYLIIGNEPNLSYEWGYQPKAAADYARLLQAVFPAVKQANPEMAVLAAGLAPNLEPAGSPWAHNDLDYLAALYAAGAAPYFDGLAAHVYGLTFPPESEPAPDILNYRRIELYRPIMAANGDEGTPIYITETGWNDHPRWTLAVRPAQRIQYTLDALRYAEDNWPDVPAVAIWAFRYPAPTNSYMDYYTLVTPEFIVRPIYEALQQFAVPAAPE